MKGRGENANKTLLTSPPSCLIIAPGCSMEHLRLLEEGVHYLHFLNCGTRGNTAFLCVCAQSCQTLETPQTIVHRLLYLWDFPGKNTAVGCHFLLQGIFLIQGSNVHFLCLLHCKQIFIYLFFTLSHRGSPTAFLHLSN